MREKDEVKYCRPRYDRGTGKFLGIYETVGFLLVRGDPNEVFLSCEYDSETSKILYSNFKKKIPSNFSSMLFNQHIKLIESTDNTDMSQLFFFLPSIADGKESLNENLTLLNLEKKELDTLCGEAFDPHKLDSKSPKMRSTVISMLEEIASISNSNLKRNADTPMCKENISVESVKWVDAVNRSIPEQFKLFIKHLTLLNLEKKELDTLCGEAFDPRKLDSKSPKMRSTVISMLEEIASISNSNLKRNADTPMCKENISVESVKWVDVVNRSIPEQFKLFIKHCRYNVCEQIYS